MKQKGPIKTIEPTHKASFQQEDEGGSLYGIEAQSLLLTGCIRIVIVRRYSKFTLDLIGGRNLTSTILKSWIPAFAGMTNTKHAIVKIFIPLLRGMV